MINDIWEESDDDAEMRRPSASSFPTSKKGFQKWEWKLQNKIIRQQQYLQVIRNCALGLFANSEQTLVGD